MVKNERQVMMQLDEAGLSMGDFSRAWSRGQGSTLVGRNQLLMKGP